MTREEFEQYAKENGLVVWSKEMSDSAIKALEQEPKTGHWIRIASGSFIDDYRCDCCNNKPPMKQITKRGTWGWDFTDFCPNCGADMRGEE